MSEREGRETERGAGEELVEGGGEVEELDEGGGEGVNSEENGLKALRMRGERNWRMTGIEKHAEVKEGGRAEDQERKKKKGGGGGRQREER